MSRQSLTIHDVANHLGLSTSTVSFVINGRASQQRISPNTVQRVNSYIEETGYVPDKRAQSFRTKKTGIIGLIVEDLSEKYTSAFLKQLEQIAFCEDFKIIVQQLGDHKKAEKILNSLYSKQIEGYLIMMSNKITDKYFKKIDWNNIPVIFFSFGNRKRQAQRNDQFNITKVNARKVKELFVKLQSNLITE